MPEVDEVPEGGGEQPPPEGPRIQVPSPPTGGRITWSTNWSVTTTTATTYYIQNGTGSTSAATFNGANNITWAPPVEPARYVDEMPSAEQIRAIQERARQANEAAQRRQQQSAQAHSQESCERAMALLRSVLEPEYRELFDRTGEVRCTGQSGIVYRLRMPAPNTWDANVSHVGNVVPLYRGEALLSFCVHLVTITHDGARTNVWDHLVGQVLGLRFEEAEFFGLANHHNNLYRPDHISTVEWMEAAQVFLQRHRELKEVVAFDYRPDTKESICRRWVEEPPFQDGPLPEVVATPPRTGPYMMAV